MPELELFFSPGACSRVTLIALEETGAPYKATPVLLAHGQQRRPQYLQLNPKGKVPLLLIDGVPLSENVAILSALARRFPEANLLPNGGPGDELQALSVWAWCASGLHPLVTRLCMPHLVCDEPAGALRVQALAATAMASSLAVIERMLDGREWLFGAWSAADAYVLWVWMRLQNAPIDTTTFPQLADHARRMLERPAVQRALAREREAAA